VLTVRRWRRADNRNLVSTLARRYLRLEIPILAVVLLVWALMQLRLTPTVVAAVIVQREDWLGLIVNFEPDVLGALWFATFRAYFLNQNDMYVPFLWTMATELWGSFIVLSLSHSPRILREPYSALALLIVLLLHFYPVAACFPAGAMIALLQRDGVIFRTEPTPRESLVASGGLIAVLAAAAVTQMLTRDLLPVVLICPILFFCVMRSLPTRRFLSGPVSQWLGRISFPLYLVQVIVLTTITSWSIIELERAELLTPWTASGVALLSVLSALLAAWAFLPIEEFSLRAAKWKLSPRRGPVPAKA
jgi:peptidoglycan/LPS O-acetylase OafA/YrhL